MQATMTATKLNLKARDATGQKRYAVKGVGPDTTVRELVARLVSQMGLPVADEANGARQVYHAYLDRDGRHLNGSETVGEALREGEEVVLHPDVQAG